MSRTKIDFSKHEVIVVETPAVTTHYLRKPNTICDSIKFINTNGILAVTGDYGNWIFCREFHPSPTGSVSDGYWMEKLQIASSQEPEEYDEEATKKELQRRLNDKEEPCSEKEKEYYESLLDYVDNESDYKHRAFEDNPGIDWEYIPFCKRTKYWLEAVFDGFEEICRRMKEGAVQ